LYVGEGPIKYPYFNLWLCDITCIEIPRYTLFKIMLEYV
jgi:hypothetical protein